jgi:hypothetical protein
VPVITVPDTLREKLGPEGTKGLVELLNQATSGARDDVVTLCTERFERRLADVKAELIRWMFIFWVGQIGALTGILFAFFRS